MKKILFLFVLLFSFFLTNLTFAHNFIERFIIMGHLYPILDDDERYQKFVDKVNSYKPDYIFILGDSEIQNKEIYKKYLNSFKTEIFFSPGNHELKKSKKNYLENVGYLDLVLEKNTARFILLNSSEDVDNIKKTLKKFLSKKFSNGPTIILTHHRIWDDTLISKKSYQHDKHFYFDEIYSIIKDDIDYIFSGNSKRQYFMDLENLPTYGKQNINNILWLDKIGSIKAYSVGMGDGSPKANFTIVDLYDDELFIRGDYSTTENYDILPKELIIANKAKLSKKYTKQNYFFINKSKFYISLIIFFLILVYFLRKKILAKIK